MHTIREVPTIPTKGRSQFHSIAHPANSLRLTLSNGCRLFIGNGSCAYYNSNLTVDSEQTINPIQSCFRGEIYQNKPLLQRKNEKLKHRNIVTQPSSKVQQHSAMTPITIAVIGGGPSGLFFCHAIGKIARDAKGRAVSVTCFERSSSPGGVWRAADPKNTNSVETTEMYDALWTNGSSLCNEFYDYTYDEHFGGKPVTVYMKRHDQLQYILGRVQKNCPDFFGKFLELSTQVDHVVYDDVQKRFDVTVTKVNVTGGGGGSGSEIRHFDKCIWACGENGLQKMPQALVQTFRDGGFAGRIIHSADTATLERDVRGKRILLVGGGFSAEDLALQSIKLGVERVYISTRYNSEVTWTTKWPMDKVKLLRAQVPFRVTENGRSIQFCEVEWGFHGYKTYYDEVETEVRDIDTIILCTGYQVNLNMLDPSLRKGFPASEFKSEKTVPIPEGWKMKENVLTKYTGEVQVADKVRYVPYVIHPELYRGVLISNPNMMFVSAYGSHVPLMACEVYAGLLAGFATGTLDLPSPDEMIAINETEALAMMDVPYFRYVMDENFCNKVNGIPNFWPENYYHGGKCPVWEQVEWEGTSSTNSV
jgi:cation diffusion facilitator CzcD-associated flavoprotein CzcO